MQGRAGESRGGETGVERQGENKALTLRDVLNYCGS